MEAVPKGRPRVTSHGTYLPKRSQQFQQELREQIQAHRLTPIDKPCRVAIQFYRPITATARKYGDIDNLVKAVLDACNGLIWVDDSLIVEMQAYKHKGEGKIEIEVNAVVD